jgi:flagellar biosynthetic protein FlhB
MAAESLPEQRTEMPTDRRYGELKREGQIFTSRDVVTVFSLLSALLLLGAIGTSLTSNLQRVMRRTFLAVGSPNEFNSAKLIEVMAAPLLIVGRDLTLFLLLLGLAGGGSTMIQTGWNIKGKWFDVKLARLNPLTGLRRIFSFEGVITTAKAIMKLLIMLPLAALILKDLAPEMVHLLHLKVKDVFVYTASASAKIYWRMLYVLIGFALFDYFYGRWNWLRFNKMTKDEVKDEKKSVEGDETTRRRIIQRGMARITQRLRTAVPKASVVITNPTHYSVALRYEEKSSMAPIVVAKGRGEIALHIREIAKEHNVPILERPPLARALFSSSKVGSEIPSELFRAVAEVFAYLYRQRKMVANGST